MFNTKRYFESKNGPASSVTILKFKGRKGIRKNWKMIDKMLASGLSIQIVKK